MQPIISRLAIFDLDDTLFSCTEQLQGLMRGALNHITPFTGIIDALSAPGFTNVLVTRGKIDEQMRKIHALRIGRHFESIFIVPTDTDKLPTFQAMVGLAERTWVIGNRLDCEIQYGIACGFTTVYMKHGWHVEREVGSEIHPHHTIHHLTELPAILMA